MDEYRRGDLTFDVVDRGPRDGPPVVLLHGFPQFNTSWQPVMDRLVDQGFRCLAPNQRGYSPRARPTRRRDYRFTELARDTVALIDELGEDRVHLVGHDLGAAVAWTLAAQVPQRLATLSALSVAHPAAFLRSIPTSRQGLASWYIYAFQLPWIPELVLSRRGNAGLAEALSSSHGQSRDAAERDARTMLDAGALRSAINWYRAMPLTDPRSALPVSVPTMFVWSDGDTACLEQGARACGRYVTGEYRFETLRGVSHWMVDERPGDVARLLAEWFAAHPLAATAP
jgi:pimeloyl-ACP methyl ester carboxylesterase